MFALFYFPVLSKRYSSVRPESGAMTFNSASQLLMETTLFEHNLEYAYGCGTKKGALLMLSTQSVYVFFLAKLNYSSIQFCRGQSTA